MRIIQVVACMLLAAWLLAGGVAAQQAEPAASAAPASVGLASGDVDETCARIAADLAAIANGERLRVLPILSRGSLRNIGDLQTLRGVDIALVHSDVLNHARRHNLYPGFAEAIRYIAKLYDSEVHVLARAEIGTIEALDGKPVAIGPAGSGADVTAAAVFKALSLNPKLVEMEPALGLEALRKGEVAALLAVTGKPAALFRMLRADAGVHLLSLPSAPSLLDLYAPARILHEDYPDLVADGRPVTTIGVGVALVVFGWPAGTERYSALARFVDAFFSGIGQLLRPPHHAKWHDVNLFAQLPGYQRFPPAAEWLAGYEVSEQRTAREALQRQFEAFLAARGARFSPAQREQLYRNLLEYLSGRR